MTLAARTGELPMLWRAGAAITRARFAADLALVERAIGPGGCLLNLCNDRFHFALLFLAACRRGVTNLLPPSETREAVAEVGAMFSAPSAITDATVQAWLAATPDHPARDVACVAPGHEAAIVFTSGSTGRSSAYRKTWATLEATAASSAPAVFGDLFCHVVATVPPQHMYGLEFSVMMALTGRAAVHAGRPLFPADVVAALDSIPSPRVLLTTPVHLRALVGARAALPPLHRVICATAPLDGALAEVVEQGFGCELHEVYGCTEAGSVALRRTARTSAWRPHSAVRVTEREGRAEISGSHLPVAQQLQDRVRVFDDGCFDLLGRDTDLIKIAGKRGSLEQLNRALLSVPGVEDGVVFMPRDDGTVRPAALVVAPRLEAAQILDALAQRVDPAFLPRPLRKLGALPRSEVGKLPRKVLLELLEAP